MFNPATIYLLPRLSFLLKFVPASVFQLVLSEWPKEQLRTIRDFLHSPSAISAVLIMAREEMEQVKTPDAQLLREQTDKIYAYYARHDDWVGEEKDLIIELLGDSSRIYHDAGNTQHAFTASKLAAMLL